MPVKHVKTLLPFVRFFPSTEQVLCRLLCDIRQCSDCSGDHPCTRHLDSLRRTAFDMNVVSDSLSQPPLQVQRLSCSLLLRHFLLTWPLLYSASSQVTFVVCWMVQMTPIVLQTGKCPPLSRRRGYAMQSSRSMWSGSAWKRLIRSKLCTMESWFFKCSKPHNSPKD